MTSGVDFFLMLMQYGLLTIGVVVLIGASIYKASSQSLNKAKEDAK